MIFDETAWSEMTSALKADGWRGDADSLRNLLRKSSLNTSVRMFTNDFLNIPKQMVRNREIASGSLPELQQQFDRIADKIRHEANSALRARYDPTYFGGGPYLSLSSPERYFEICFERGSTRGSGGYWGRDAIITREGLPDGELETSELVVVPRRPISTEE